MKDPLYLLDGYSLIYRSYFAFIRNPLRNPEGRNSSAVFGFFNSLLTLLKNRTPPYFAIVLDSRIPTFRHTLYPEYKATRQKTPEDLHAQVPVIEELATCLGIPILRFDGVEADDLMATLAKLCRQEGRPCYIISGDKDLLQLVNDPVRILKPEKGDFLELDREGVYRHWSVYPEQIVDYLSLVGDASDNVPGAKGIGEKTAVALLSQFGSLEGIYRNLDALPPSQRQKLIEAREAVELSKRLVTLKDDVPVHSDVIEAFRLPPLKVEDALPLFYREGMKNLAQEFYSFKTGAPLKIDKGLPLQKDSLIFSSSPSTLTGFSSPGTYKTISSGEELSTLLEQARNAGTVAFDTETTDLDPFHAKLVGFSLSFELGKAFYIPIQAPSGGLGEGATLPLLEKFLSDPTVRIVGQNLKFDYKILRLLGIQLPMQFDTMIAAWLLDSGESSYNLDRLAEIYLGYQTVRYQDVVAKGQTFADVPLDLATRYAAEDADITYRLYRVLEPSLKERKLEDLFYTLEMPLVPILGDMELEGIRLDVSVLKTYGFELEKEIDRIQRQIYQLCGKEFNINSTKQLQEVLFIDRKLQPTRKTEKKTGFSTDTSVLEELAQQDPVPELVLQYRMLQKLKSTYVDALPQMVNPRTGRIHTSFNQTGTATGRLSSKDPNLQNIPIRDEEGRRIRSAFIPREGWKFLSADYSQIELVILAHLSGDPGLCEAFQTGSDVHRRTGALIFGVPEDQVTPEQRRVAKTINFGVMYGMSSFRLSRELGIPRKDADRFLDFYFRQYPRIQSFIGETIRKAEQSGKVSTILGRERPVPNINSRNKTEKTAAERIAINTPIQGSAADMVKLAMLRIVERLKKEHYNARLILQVHDELIFEVPQEELDGVKELVQKEMEQVYPLRVPLRVSIETGSSWGELH
ncbi:MAG: DNA polymerase I [Spirochaetes bacterium]|nr:DNA polymerase I [Spirochaetota bacterium]